jgi:hypothetical protein
VSADWFESESELLSWRRELDRLKRRARARLFRTLALTALATGMVVYMAAKRVPLAESRILIRVTEGTVLREDSPTTTRDLGQFLNDSALSGRNLMELIEKRGLYPFERTRGDQFALEELRANITLEVYRNQFIEARGYNDDVRTARVSIRFRDSDPAVSFAVAGDLARLVISSESRRRADTSRDVAGLIQVAVDQAHQRMNDRENRLAAARLALAEAKRARKKDEQSSLRIQIDRLEDELKDQIKLLATMRKNKARADLRSALDAGSMNMQYQIVDERPPPPPDQGRPIRLAMVALAGFLILLPLCAVGVGAFDSRIHDREDVQRLGFEVVGHVPRFGGSEVGSLRSRQGGSHRRDRPPMT